MMGTTGRVKGDRLRSLLAMIGFRNNMEPLGQNGRARGPLAAGGGGGGAPAGAAKTFQGFPPAPIPTPSQPPAPAPAAVARPAQPPAPAPAPAPAGARKAPAPAAPAPAAPPPAAPPPLPQPATPRLDQQAVKNAENKRLHRISGWKKLAIWGIPIVASLVPAVNGILALATFTRPEIILPLLKWNITVTGLLGTGALAALPYLVAGLVVGMVINYAIARPVKRAAVRKEFAKLNNDPAGKLALIWVLGKAPKWIAKALIPSDRSLVDLARSIRKDKSIADNQKLLEFAKNAQPAGGGAPLPPAPPALPGQYANDIEGFEKLLTDLFKSPTDGNLKQAVKSHPGNYTLPRFLEILKTPEDLQTMQTALGTLLYDVILDADFENINEMPQDKLIYAHAAYRTLLSLTEQSLKVYNRGNNVPAKIEGIKNFIIETSRQLGLEVVACDSSDPNKEFTHRYYILPSTLADPAKHHGILKAGKIIGKGGMAEVYAGYDFESNRVVAVKVLEPQNADETIEVTIDRFKREYNNLKKAVDDTAEPLKAGYVHPYDFGKVAGKLSIVMEYVPWQQLKQFRIDPNNATVFNNPTVILKIGIALCRLVANLHAMGMNHRDLKPNNVFIKYDPATQEVMLKLSDFGIAKSEGDLTLTATNLTPGSPHFASPDYLREGGDPENRILNDIFGIAGTLYYLSSGLFPVWEIEAPEGKLLVKGAEAHCKLTLGLTGTLQSKGIWVDMVTDGKSGTKEVDTSFEISGTLFPIIQKACCPDKTKFEHYQSVNELLAALEAALAAMSKKTSFPPGQRPATPPPTAKPAKAPAQAPAPPPAQGIDNAPTEFSQFEVGKMTLQARADLLIDALNNKKAEDRVRSLLDQISIYLVGDLADLDLTALDNKTLRRLKAAINMAGSNYPLLTDLADAADQAIKSLL